MTEPTEPVFDRTGYTVIEQSGTSELGRPTQTTYAVIRDADGVGLGAYASEDDVNLVIEHDRAVLAEQGTPEDVLAATRERAKSRPRAEGVGPDVPQEKRVQPTKPRKSTTRKK